MKRAHKNSNKHNKKTNKKQKSQDNQCYNKLALRQIMDILSHGLWGGAITAHRGRKFFWLGFLIGILPDLLSFGPHLFDMVFGDGWHVFGEKPPITSLPPITFTLYNISHSLIIFSIVFLASWFFWKKPFLPLLAWGLHIVMDIPSHTNAYFPTPFLWPISDFTVNGTAWISPKIFIPNILLLTFIYLFIFSFRRKTMTPKNLPVTNN